LQNLFRSPELSQESVPLKDQQEKHVLALIQGDLKFLFPLLIEFPKCYWIWNHRLWLLGQATALLPVPTARRIWQEELALVGKMLNRDSRNFHGWGYRRMVVSSLESPALNVLPEGPVLNSKEGVLGSMANEEFEYTTKMIKTDLSNFSAWHNRTKLIIRLLDERSASDLERRQWLDNG
jgi:geranylgeranyl transferase type-2 subunit alpha